MAVSTFTGQYKPNYGVSVTAVTDSSADWASVSNSTYFYDIADGLTHYKDALSGISVPFFNDSELFCFVSSKTHLPEAVAGVITLAANATYYFVNTLDLTGDRLVCGANTTILGSSSENCRLISTGLSAATALISSAWSLPVRNITISHGTAIDLDATANANQALDWAGVNFTDCAIIGTIKNYNNFIATDSALLNSQGLTFDGSIGTVGFSNTLFDNTTSGTTLIFPATLTITRRIRIIYSSFVSSAGETGISLNASAVVPVEGYILDTLNFTGGGTYTSGVLYSDNKSLFTNCKGIINSGNIAQYYMTANATDTVVTTQDVFYKVLGTTTSGSFVEKFTLTDNKAEYAGAIDGFYKVTAYISCSSGNNNVVRARIAKNGTDTASSESKSTTSAAGKSENVVCADIVQLATTDYIEIFMANGTGTSDILVTELNVIIERLN